MSAGFVDPVDVCHYVYMSNNNDASRYLSDTTGNTVALHRFNYQV